MKRVLLGLLISVTAFAQTAAIDLKLNQPAPFPGTLLPFDYAAKLRKDVEIGDLNKQKVDILTAQVGLESKRADQWMNTSQDLAQRNVAAQSISTYKIAGGFFLGVLSTVLIAYAVKGATK